MAYMPAASCRPRPTWCSRNRQRCWPRLARADPKPARGVAFGRSVASMTILPNGIANLKKSFPSLQGATDSASGPWQQQKCPSSRPCDIRFFWRGDEISLRANLAFRIEQVSGGRGLESGQGSIDPGTALCAVRQALREFPEQRQHHAEEEQYRRNVCGRCVQRRWRIFLSWRFGLRGRRHRT
jgi:hypothetical protein